MSKTCGANRTGCPKCDYRYKKEDAKGAEAACPQCQHPRLCQSKILMVNGRCKAHGGKTPRGIAAPGFKHGAFSKYLHGNLSAMYQEALTDVDLMDIKGEMALLYARLCQLLESGESEDLWSAAKGAWFAFKDAYSKGDRDALAEALDELDKLMTRGGEEAGRWNEIYQVQTQLLRNRESERRRLVEMQQMISAEQAMLLISALTHAIRQNVSDRAALTRITDAVVRLVGRPVGERLIGSGEP